MDFEFSPSEKELQQKLRRFIQEDLTPAAEEWGRLRAEGRATVESSRQGPMRAEAGENPLAQGFGGTQFGGLRGGAFGGDIRERLVARAKSLGLWNLNVPREYGGAELNNVEQLIVLEEMSKSPVQFQFGGGAPNILYGANEEQKKKYLIPCINGEKRASFGLTEPGAGSDPSMLQTTARRDGDNFVLNGTKTFISGAEAADFVMVFAREPGTVGRHGVTCFLVDSGTPGYRVSRRLVTMAGWGPCELVFEDCVVPSTQVLGEVGRGFAIGQSWLGAGRMNIGVGCALQSEKLVDFCLKYMNDNPELGRESGERVAWELALADTLIETQALRRMTYHAAWKADQGTDTRQEAAMIKLYGSEVLHRAVDRAVQIHGLDGYSKLLPFEGAFRAARLWRIGEGASEVQKFVIARNLLRDGGVEFYFEEEI